MKIKYDLYRLKPGDSGMLKPSWENDNVTSDRYKKIRRDTAVIDTKDKNEYYLLQQLCRINNMPGERERYGMVASDVVVLNPRTKEEAAYYCNGLDFCKLKEFHLEPEPETFTLYGYDKDNDVCEALAESKDPEYIRIIAKAVMHYHMHVQEIRRKSNNEPFDWFELSSDGDTPSMLFTYESPEGMSVNGGE